MRIGILTKIKGVGFGNIIEFIPSIKMLNPLNDVFTDNDFLIHIGIARRAENNEFNNCDGIFVPNWPNVFQQVRLLPEYFNIPIYGFKSRVKGFQVNLLYEVGLKVETERSEIEQNKELVRKSGVPFLEKVTRHGNSAYSSMNKLWVIGLSDRIHWIGLDEFLGELRNYTVIGGPDKSNWLTNSELIDLFTRKDIYFFGFDNGIMHLADYYRVPGTILWNEKPHIFFKSFPENLDVIRCRYLNDLNYELVIAFIFKR